MNLACARGILIVAVESAFGRPVAPAQRPCHHQIMAETGFGHMFQKFRHGFDDGGMIALPEPFQPLQIRLSRFRAADVMRSDAS